MASTEVARPTSPAAAVALNRYDRAMNLANAAWSKAAAAAKRGLIAELKLAEKKALETNDLDEATRISSLSKMTQDELAEINTTAGPPARGLVIMKAVYGAGEKWDDVIRGSYGGLPFVLSFSDGNPKATLVFGMTPAVNLR